MSMKPPTHPSGVPFRVALSTGGTRRRAYESSNKYVQNARSKLSGRDLTYVAGVSYYNGYLCGVKAERERLTGSKRKTPKRITVPPLLDAAQRYSLAEAAAILRVGIAQVFREMRAGKLPTFKDGRRTFVSGADLIERSAPPVLGQYP